MNVEKEIAERIAAAALRAIAEAELRRAGNDDVKHSHIPERGGRGGLDPTRFGDWEIKGIACDF